MLEKKGYVISLYDPYFWPDKEPLKRKYDFISATEVLEHLCEPAKELTLLQNLIRPGGILVVMTLFFTEATDFSTWYYRRDPTHIGFYSSLTLEWIAKFFDFKLFEIFGERIAVFQK
jgi:hypothetical protein